MGELSAPVVVLRVTVRAPDLDAFITRYSRHIAGDRIFIFSKAPQPVGTQVRFNLQLTSGEVLIQGRGTVKRVQADVGDNRHPPGMEVQFKPLDERSATLVDFMMATRAGLTENIATAAASSPIVRALVPPKPKPATPLPSKSKPIAIAKSPAPLPPPPSPPSSPSSPLAASLKPKPIPVARPPSLSLESAWKSEAGEEATQVSSTAATEVSAAEVDSSPLALLAAGALDRLPSGAPPDAPSGAPPDAPSGATSDAPSGATSGATSGAPSDAPSDKPADLATIIPPTVDPSVNAPPVFAESWGGDAPANPFSDVSDGAIEYFVEWSLEQSIGPRALPQARFSDVPMVLPGQSGKFQAFDPVSPRRRWTHVAAVFAAGALVGGIVVALAKRAPHASSPSSAASAPLAAAVEPSAAAAPLPSTSQKPAPSKSDAAGGELAITTRPAGASVTIDGVAAGTTPLTKQLPAGKHELVVTKERYSAITTTSDAPGSVALDLRRPAATLHVASTPPAADVVIAGEHRGKTPLDVKLPGFESYDVHVGKSWHKKVYLSHAQNRLDATLAAPARAGRR